MKIRRPLFLWITLFAWVALTSVRAADAKPSFKPIYTNDFEKAELDKVPSDFIVQEGAFAVKEEAGNRYLELPGAPVETFTTVFGPTEKDDVAVSARIFGTLKGRRFPAFGIGLNGISGYRLQISPAKKLLELYRGDDLKTSVPYDWQSGKWTRLFLFVKKTGDNSLKITGKAWVDGTPEPAGSQITVDDTPAPSAGRAVILGAPYATTSILFDDLQVLKLVP